LCLLHDIRKETAERLIYVTKHLCFDPYQKYEYTIEHMKNERRKDRNGIAERERERERERDEGDR